MKNTPEHTPEIVGNIETSDLRNSRMYKEPALLLAYNPLPRKATDYLKIDTQQKFIDAANEARLAMMP